MTKMFSLAAAGLMATGLTFATPQTSEAGKPFGFSVNFGRAGFSYQQGRYGPYNRYGYYPGPRRRFGPGCGPRPYYGPRGPRVDIRYYDRRGPRRGFYGPYGPGPYYR